MDYKEFMGWAKAVSSTAYQIWGDAIRSVCAEDEIEFLYPQNFGNASSYNQYTNLLVYVVKKNVLIAISIHENGTYNLNTKIYPLRNLEKVVKRSRDDRQEIMVELFFKGQETIVLNSVRDTNMQWSKEFGDMLEKLTRYVADTI